MFWKDIMLVGIGGGGGSIMRFIIQQYALPLRPGTFPWATFIVNITGCLIIGVLYGLAEKTSFLTPQWRLLLATGFCGGYTTFSAFAYENSIVLKTGNISMAAIYAVASVILGILGVFAGSFVVKSM